jgi:hypothetical protein
MPILKIDEIINPNKQKLKPIKEKQDIFIPNIIDKNIPRRNGSIVIFTGSGGSGKTSTLLNMFKSKNQYRGKFNNIYYFCPMASFLSITNHPFKNIDNLYHDLTISNLENIYNELVSKREAYEEYLEKQKEKKRRKNKKKKTEQFIEYEESESESDDENEITEIEYSCVIIDDFADSLKDNDIQRQLNKMLIKARHLCCMFIFTLQSYLYFPKMLRKQITYAIIFKPKSIAEWNSITDELIHYNKEDSLTLFNYIFDANYNTFGYDTVENKTYKNFNLLNIENK